MPLVRFQLRNECALGAPELYKEANKEDPKAILDGVAVAGLVGILRQLGDLAEFASDIFHDLQEQVAVIASRSHRMMVRVQHIEAAVPTIEKDVTAQRSHIHFAYTAGSDWHARIRPRKNHLIQSDLPQLIMDSYEECRDPPRLHLLDKFDTGGPGSCLRRYSDPSFFKRVLANSDLESAEKVQKRKKAHKIKKRGSRLRNREVLQGASISYQSGRTRFASQNNHDHISAAQTMSTFDIRSNSSLGDQSTSFDSRNRSSDYIECVFDACSTMQPEEKEDNGLSNSRLKMPSSDNLFSVDSFDHHQVENGDLPHILQEQNAPSSSCVTWDEKTEIVESAGQECNSIVDIHSEVPELLSPSSDLDMVDRPAMNLGSIDQTDILCNDEKSAESFSGGDQFDEIGSETDRYMDALNTMESESETDLECQTKREVEISMSDSIDRGMEGGTGVTNEKTAQCSDSSDIESGEASYSFSNKEISDGTNNSINYKGLDQQQPCKVSGMLSNPVSSPDTDLCRGAIHDFSTIQSIISDPSSSGSKTSNSQEPPGDKIVSSLYNSQESPAEMSSVAPSVMFWTNGGLLGLQPSKPPACSVPNVESQDSTPGRKYDAYDPSTTAKVDGTAEKVDILVKTPDCIEKNPSPVGKFESEPDTFHPAEFSPNQLIRRTTNLGLTNDHSECGALSHDNQNDGTLFSDQGKNSSGFSSAVLGAKLEKFDNSPHKNSFDNHRHNLEVTNIKTQGAVLPVAPDAKTPSTEAIQENIESSTSMFGLGHKYLLNGFHRKASFVHYEKSEPISSFKTSVKTEEPLFREQNGQKRVSHESFPEPNLKRHFECGSPANSLSSSPPLEHMKISYHPINGFETSMLRLKFPDGHHSHDDIRDAIFPSFQLLPEPDLQPHDIESDSDDETLYRSSPCVSEDLLSHQSDSNSEQWESDRTPGSKHQESYDGLHGVSSNKSISSSLDLEEIDNTHNYCHVKSLDADQVAEPFHSGSLLDLPSLEALTISKQDGKLFLDPKDLSGSDLQDTDEPTPTPPPLPPMQWRTTKTQNQFSEAEEKQLSVSEILDHLNKMQLPGTTTCQKPKPAQQNQPHKEVTAFPIKSKQDQKFNGQKEANLVANGKEMDEKEDLLHQIRNKSFNLRRTVKSQPTLTSGPATNTKVAAILEKANAIRQAFVGSDDGGDDETWSDS